MLVSRKYPNWFPVVFLFSSVSPEMPVLPEALAEYGAVSETESHPTDEDTVSTDDGISQSSNTSRSSCSSSERNSYLHSSMEHISDESNQQGDTEVDAPLSDSVTDVTDNTDLSDVESMDEQWDEETDPLGIRRGGLRALTREWILKQLGRVCLESVSNDYFDFAIEYADIFLQIKKKFPSQPPKLRDLRGRVKKEHIPELKMDFTFDTVAIDDEVGGPKEIMELDCVQFPRRRFPADRYNLVSQVTRVKVRH